MRKTSVLTAAVLSFGISFGIAAMAPLCAQRHPGGINIGGGYPLVSSSWGEGAYTCNKNSPVYTTLWNFTSPGTLTYFPYYWHGARMDVDNRSYVHVAAATNAPQYTHTGGVYVFDQLTQSARTIAKNAQDFASASGLEVTSDGDYLVVANTPAPASNHHLLRVKPSGGYSTVLTTAQLGYTAQFIHAAREDVASGDVLVPISGTQGSTVNPVLAVSGDNALRTFHASTSGPFPPYGFEQDHRTGDCYYSTGSRIMRFEPGNRPQVLAADLSTILPPATTGHGAVLENQTIANPQLIVHVHSYANSGSRTWLCWFDRQANWTVTKTTAYFTASNRQKVLAYPNLDIFHDKNNYIQPIKTAARSWSIDIDMPAYALKSYIMLPTLSGHVPGFRVDTRRVFLNWDAATNAAVQNAIPGVWSQGSGILGTSGRANGKLNLTNVGLPSGLQFVVHLVVAVVDPSAPSGVSFITEATPLQVNT